VILLGIRHLACFPQTNPKRVGRLGDRANDRPARLLSQNLFPIAISRNKPSEMGKRERSRLTSGRYRQPENAGLNG
jgi:hypothetical protein